MTRHLRTDQAGFTLIEMLVAAAGGIAVLFALGTIMIVTLHQTQRTNGKIDATRQARTALSRIENELHSACAGGNASPIQQSSSGTDLIFLSYVGTSDRATPVWHDIQYAQDQRTRKYTLTDYSYSVSPSDTGGWSRATLTGSAQLLDNVVALPLTPVFQYFAYTDVDGSGNYFTGSDGKYYYTVPDGTNAHPVTGAQLAAAPLATPLSTDDAGDAVEIALNLGVNSSASGASSATAYSATDSISLRLTTPQNSSSLADDSADYAPCQ